MAHRCHDAKDILTATVGRGAGSKLRAGPLQLGIMLNGQETGLRGGTVLQANTPSAAHNRSESLDALFLTYGVERFNGNVQAQKRGKSFQALTISMLSVPIPDHILPSSPMQQKCSSDSMYNPIAYWTQVEAAVGWTRTVRFGINIGELVDFLLGWTTIDIFADDMDPVITTENDDHLSNPG